jgi:hypothetical protein
VLFLGEARLNGVATVCDAPEGVFDRKCIECVGIVVARPFFEMGMARMSRVGDHFEQFVEAWDAAAILGRSIPFATDEMRIGTPDWPARTSLTMSKCSQRSPKS